MVYSDQEVSVPVAADRQVAGQILARRANSFSTASRMKAARLFGPAKASIRSTTSGARRTSVAFTPRAGLPMRAGLAGIALSDNLCMKPLSLIDGVSDNAYISVIGNGRKQMTYALTFTNDAGRTFEAKEMNGKFFYYSRLAGRWLPAKRSQVST